MLYGWCIVRGYIAAGLRDTASEVLLGFVSSNCPAALRGWVDRWGIILIIVIVVIVVVIVRIVIIVIVRILVLLRWAQSGTAGLHSWQEQNCWLWPCEPLLSPWASAQSLLLWYACLNYLHGCAQSTLRCAFCLVLVCAALPDLDWWGCRGRSPAYQHWESPKPRVGRPCFEMDSDSVVAVGRWQGSADIWFQSNKALPEKEAMPCPFASLCWVGPWDI